VQRIFTFHYLQNENVIKTQLSSTNMLPDYRWTNSRHLHLLTSLLSGILGRMDRQ